MSRRPTPVRGYTLVEVLTASAVMLLVVAAALSALLASQRFWRHGVERGRLSQQTRLVRERLLGGIDGRYGLRFARRGSVQWTSNILYVLDGDQALAVGLVSNEPVWADTGGARRPVLADGPVVERAAVVLDGNQLRIELTLAFTNGAARLAQPQVLTAVLLNE